MSNLRLRQLLDIAKEELSGLTSVNEPDFRLEEVRKLENGSDWEVVVSFLTENVNKKVLPDFMLPFERIYKRLKINIENKVTEMTMYKG